MLGHGCVQEEIRFMLCPELLVTRLLAEALDKTEAIIVVGEAADQRVLAGLRSGDAGSWEWRTLG